MPLKIFLRGKFYACAGTVNGERIRRSTKTSNKERAQRIAARIENQAWTRHLDGPGATLVFADAAIAYRKAGKSTRHLDRVEDHWKNTPVRKITSGAVKAAAIKVYPTAGAATRNRQFIVPTQAIINHAAELEWCPPLRVKRFKVETKVKEPATLEWVQAFAAHASPHLGAMALFMFATGARVGEATALTWADMDLERRTAVIRQTKTGGDERKAHLPAPVLAAIANIPSNRQPEEKVFRYVGRESVRQVWDNAIKRAGIKKLSPHCCRHGFATTMLQKGIDVKTVAELGGWKDVATLVKTYAHAMRDRTVTNVLFGTDLTQAADVAELSNQKDKGILK